MNQDRSTPLESVVEATRGGSDRFWAKVDKSAGPDACWAWTATHSGTGYGYFSIGGRGYRSHRVAYELTVGPIPDGLQLDHLCRNKGCVNPAHLEPVTPRENTLRGTSPPAHRARQTHCKRGHELTPENTYRRPDPNDRRRNCLVCERARWVRT